MLKTTGEITTQNIQQPIFIIVYQTTMEKILVNPELPMNKTKNYLYRKELIKKLRLKVKKLVYDS